MIIIIFAGSIGIWFLFDVLLLHDTGVGSGEIDADLVFLANKGLDSLVLRPLLLQVFSCWIALHINYINIIQLHTIALQKIHQLVTKMIKNIPSHEIMNFPRMTLQMIKLSLFQKIFTLTPMQVQKITFEIKTQNDQPKSFSFDPRILVYNIQYVSNNHHEPYPIPKNVATSLRPFQIMNQFVLAHNYSIQSFKVVKPLNSSNYAELVDPITFKIFSKYCDEKYASEATEVIKLAEYIRFHQLSDAVSTAVATNYYIGQAEKSLEEFIKKNGLEDISSEQICEIIKLYEDQFRMIEHKYKEEMRKVPEMDVIQQSS